jgi:hypothetical protein
MTVLKRLGSKEWHDRLPNGLHLNQGGRSIASESYTRRQGGQLRPAEASCNAHRLSSKTPLTRYLSAGAGW